MHVAREVYGSDESLGFPVALKSIDGHEMCRFSLAVEFSAARYGFWFSRNSQKPVRSGHTLSLATGQGAIIWRVPVRSSHDFNARGAKYTSGSRSHSTLRCPTPVACIYKQGHLSYVGQCSPLRRLREAKLRLREDRGGNRGLAS